MFKDDHPNYKSYDDTLYHVKDVPSGLVSAIQGLIVRNCETDGELKTVVNAILLRIPTEPSQNWGYSWLVEELDGAMRRISQGTFHKFMDAMVDVCDVLKEPFVSELNEELEEHDFGYFVESSFPTGFHWMVRDEQEIISDEIEESRDEVKDICQQTQAHLTQSLTNIMNDSQRARKDAVRDAMSAMESLVKKVSGTDDIKEAVKYLRAHGEWGNNDILKDGLSIWNKLHDLYPDVRHGNPDITEIEKDEAAYWIERILAYINFIARRYRTVSR
ncbi:hypothetical protein [Alicyclobacillus acidiphilus]|uniref:hypothetical protein n=1 Tax=Alicyclobacillus acidiphilus TaxID=182455 RepID=UPI0008334BE8|nr:hypothetical protein [Alicyclobacillus acidiphilus]